MAKSKDTPKKKTHYVAVIWTLFGCGLLLLSSFFYLLSKGYLGELPSFEVLENPDTNLSTEIYTADGKLIGSYYYENRSAVSFTDISPNMINAIISIEDKRFYEHSGVDGQSLFRVVWGVVSGQKQGGGSTLTQQLAKNLYPRDERLSKMELVFRKFQEWIIAIRLEYNYSKDEILEMYLNTVFYGQSAYGIEKAAQTFFDVSASELNIEQAALLAAVVNAPSAYNPLRHPEKAMARRNLVISRMVENGFVDQIAADSIKEIPIDLSKYKYTDHNEGSATYLREYLRKQLTEWAKTHYKDDGTPYDIYRDGLRVYTTIDSRLQQYAEEAVAQHLRDDLQKDFFKEMKGKKFAPFVLNTQKEVDQLLEISMRRSDRYYSLKRSGMDEDSILLNFHTPVDMTVFSWNGPIDTVLSPWDSMIYAKHYLHSALVSVENGTGQVKAYVGGINYRFFKYDHITQGRRQVGSTFKPFLFTLAMQEGGYTPCTTLPYLPYSIKQEDGTYWQPRDSHDKHKGQEKTLKWSLANSSNWISAYLMDKFGPNAVINMARNMGVTSPLEAVSSLCLGVCDLSVYEMAAAFSCYANQGFYIKPYFITRIEDRNGNIIDLFVPEQHEAMNEVTAYKMIELMRGVVQTGTGVRLRYKYKINTPVAGKTGTTQNNSDGWFMGITPEMTTAVWTGAEDRATHFRSMNKGQGANSALPIFGLYLQKIQADTTLNFGKRDFVKPMTDVMLEFDCDATDKTDDLKNPQAPASQGDDFNFDN